MSIAYLQVTAKTRVNILRKAGEGLDWFVETGTADGYTTKALMGDFQSLITIELDYPRYLHVSTKEFLGTNVTPLHGDSTSVLREVVHWLPGPALFWLDAHYSGGVRGDKDTPIMEELDALIPSKHPHVILIDDARLFGKDPAYPAMDWVEQFVDSRNEFAEATSRYKVKVENDIIFITP